MGGYYERLEAQLAQATERGARRRGIALPRISRWRVRLHLRSDWVAGAVALAVTVTVLVVFLGVRSKHAHRSARPAVATHPGTGGLPVIRNYARGAAPALGGQLFCNASLHSPSGHASPTGFVVINTRPPTRYVYSITAAGLRPSRPGAEYEVWALPETSPALGGGTYRLLTSQPPLLLGVIKPSVGRDGRLAAEGLVPQSLNGQYRMVITIQPPAMKTPGHVVLEGDDVVL
jgi:hypothetical protein